MLVIAQGFIALQKAFKIESSLYICGTYCSQVKLIEHKHESQRKLLHQAADSM